MIEQRVDFDLPQPWNGARFTSDHFGELSFLVGPNGSGKSRFAETLARNLPNTRILKTDRLDGISPGPLTSIYGDHHGGGFRKDRFNQFRQAGTAGSGVDAFVLLEERPDIRIIVEATLSNLFDRDISLEWDSGNLVPKVQLTRTGASYRMDRDECHGIRELLVLLTHLHNDEYSFLIIDEPELNLHPQFQSFFIQEVRKAISAPLNSTSRKAVFLITHSPFILDLRSMDDMQSIFSFSANHTIPKFIGHLKSTEQKDLVALIPRLNVHHKQLFFADHPIFVEGILDAQLIEAIQERRKTSVTAAGSCLIDVGGCEELTKYVELCRHFGKQAYFVFDLDSLFVGSLRRCLRADGSISEFLAGLGLGTDFVGYCGSLDQTLTPAVRKIEEVANAQGVIAELREYFLSIPEGDHQRLARQRVAVLVEIAKNRVEMIQLLQERVVADLEGRLGQIRTTLQKKNIFLLPGGALEHYLPSYAGNRHKLGDEAKKVAVAAEVALLTSGTLDESLPERYGELFKCIAALPAKPPVDIEAVLQGYVSNYIHELQGLVVRRPDWTKAQLVEHFASSQNSLSKLIELAEFTRARDREFVAVLKIAGTKVRFVDVSHLTNAGMRQFAFRCETDGPSSPAG